MGTAVTVVLLPDMMLMCDVMGNGQSINVKSEMS